MKNEEKRARFVRVAKRRTQRVLESLQMLGNCTSPASYEYEPPQVEQTRVSVHPQPDPAGRHAHPYRDGPTGQK